VALTIYEHLSTSSIPQQLKLPLPITSSLIGTRHEGALWVSRVRATRKAVVAMADIASQRPEVTPDAVGMRLIDILPELDPGELHSLDVTAAMLVRRARRRRR
jgi:hypothetical protein